MITFKSSTYASTLAPKPTISAISSNTLIPPFQGDGFPYTSHPLPTFKSQKPAVYFGAPKHVTVNLRKDQTLRPGEVARGLPVRMFTKPIKTAQEIISQSSDNSRILVSYRHRSAVNYSTYDPNSVSVANYGHPGQQQIDYPQARANQRQITYYSQNPPSQSGSASVGNQTRPHSPLSISGTSQRKEDEGMANFRKKYEALRYRVAFEETTNGIEFVARGQTFRDTIVYDQTFMSAPPSQTPKDMSSSSRYGDEGDTSSDEDSTDSNATETGSKAPSRRPKSHTSKSASEAGYSNLSDSDTSKETTHTQTTTSTARNAKQTKTPSRRHQNPLPARGRGRQGGVYEQDREEKLYRERLQHHDTRGHIYMPAQGDNPPIAVDRHGVRHELKPRGRRHSPARTHSDIDDHHSRRESRTPSHTRSNSRSTSRYNDSEQDYIPVQPKVELYELRPGKLAKDVGTAFRDPMTSEFGQWGEVVKKSGRSFQELLIFGKSDN
jgi:hypothetical protein